MTKLRPLLAGSRQYQQVLARSLATGSRQQDHDRFRQDMGYAPAAIGLAVGGGILIFATRERQKLLAEYAGAEGGKRTFSAASFFSRKSAEKPMEAAPQSVGGRRQYSAAEVRQHDTREKGIWVSYKGGVYDITKLVDKHPGKIDITVAAGKQLEPFFDQYKFHKGNSHVTGWLESFRIGDLKGVFVNMPAAGDRREGLPEYSMAQVGEHSEESTGVWVTYKHGVYDITKFIPEHPGARNLLMAAGSAVEPFWEVYPVHKNNQEVYELLEKYRIGNLREEDVVKPEDSSGAFSNEPQRHRALKVVSDAPFNAETPLPLLSDSFLTPNDLFYVRSHLATPDIKVEDYELDVHISGPGDEGKTFTLEDLKKFPKYTVVSTIQCGGNRRAEMHAARALKGLQWTGGAIGNAAWTGARLCDVLKAAGYTDETRRDLHVQFEGYDLGADSSPYGASIPIDKGIDPRGDVILAYEMNGAPIPRDHGFPVRAVVPGVVGARNVKWLNRIIISEEESQSHWQQSDYKSFAPSVDWSNVDWKKSPAIQATPVTSAICNPPVGTQVKQGAPVEVSGYAYSGGGKRIIRVEVSSDQGKTWQEAEIVNQDSSMEPRHYGWTLWRAAVSVPKSAKDLEVWCKAVDSDHNVQPEGFENIWNLRGFLANAYFRAKYRVQ